MFSDEEISQLAAEIDAQLLEVRSLSGDASLKSGDKEAQLVKQNEAITTATKEPAKSFLQKFWKAAKADLCEEEGMLYKQWKKWGDLDNKETISKFGGLLAGMGFSGEFITPIVVSVSVIVLHIGVKAFCDEYGDHKENS
ncbi:hypothetical protein VB774_02695 [Pseudanabaena galeata UHCC 0370]|uniref:Uncharacterized protein n=1 Tax=Pseudanabaena galeata UHCC 0370 TaxID=3110310 RepID=A0ABU5TFQ7_9CYAN|nr:hypothetical protein [Pseudanabaena galeata]MEA5476518.1 hypothetical protein [Pseudanabaena galeata UHCC 0370]